MGELLILIGAGLVIALAFKKYKAATTNTSHSTAQAQSENSRTLVDGKIVRLTDEQMSCLMDASSGKTIYGENFSFKFAQMPPGSVCYNVRTVNSLVNRGFLESNNSAGYVKTEKTDFAIKSSMGF